VLIAEFPTFPTELLDDLVITQFLWRAHRRNRRPNRSAMLDAPTTDQSLVESATDPENQAAWMRLYDDHRRPVLSHCSRSRLTPMESEVVGQEVLARLAQRLAKAPFNWNAASLRGWLGEMANRAIFDLHRRSRRDSLSPGVMAAIQQRLPPPFPPRRAVATATLVNGFVVGAEISDGGFGYTAVPAVRITGGGGSGATAVAVVENGVVTAIAITNPGSGYTGTPQVSIASPLFSPELKVAVSRVTVTSKVVLGLKYLPESSADLQTWTAVGAPFVAESEELNQECVVGETGQFFRITQVP
jgi:DNA-directed RNA polymerase specialized sigma24 family protein